MDIQFKQDLSDVIARARDAGVTRIVIPGIDVASSKVAIQIAEDYPGIYAAVGIHPESSMNVTDADFVEIEQMATHPKVVAIGEVGLDYYWETAPRAHQQRVLRAQIAMARNLHLPIIIHNRDATEDVLAVLKTACGGDVIGVMHCFTGSFETAKQCMDLGFFISFGGPLTFKNARNVHEVSAKIPMDALLIETDSPYLTPHPFRGKRNEPAYVQLVAQKLAELRAETLAHVAESTTSNALRLFGKIEHQKMSEVRNEP